MMIRVSVRSCQGEGNIREKPDSSRGGSRQPEISRIVSVGFTAMSVSRLLKAAVAASVSAGVALRPPDFGWQGDGGADVREQCQRSAGSGLPV